MAGLPVCLRLQWLVGSKRLQFRMPGPSGAAAPPSEATALEGRFVRCPKQVLRYLFCFQDRTEIATPKQVGGTASATSRLLASRGEAPCRLMCVRVWWL